MKWLVTALAGFVFATGGRVHLVAAHGVELRVPAGWHRLAPTQNGAIDPRTLLVVGTDGVIRNLNSVCQIAAYRVPATGAVVVVVGWRTATSGGGDGRPTGRTPLQNLVRVTKPSFECYDGLGAAASLVLGGKAYQVNVMVGDRASKERIAEALAVGRSFDVAR